MYINSRDNDVFLKRLTATVEANLSNEKFGVNELAEKIGLNRSQIHRKLKSICNKSGSQFIREIRLEKARNLLNDGKLTVSEIAYNVGFGSPSYFIKCFHEKYGYSPGEAQKHIEDLDLKRNTELNVITQEKGILRGKKKNRLVVQLLFTLLLIVLISATFFLSTKSSLFSNFNHSDKEISILVLPVTNLTQGGDYQYFAEGIREDLLNNLYWITSLRVISRTTGEQFRESNLSVEEIAKQVNARYVLESSMRVVDKNMRIVVQLIDSKTDDHIWSASYDKELNDILGLQDEIALQVASKIKTKLSVKERQRIEKISTSNPKAYEYFLQARFLHNKTTSELRSGFDKAGVENCIKYYELAIAEDENFAEAYAELALANFNLTAWRFIPTRDGFIKAHQLSLKALQIDPDCAMAHAVLAAYNIWGIRNFEVGRKEYETAIRLNPHFATVRQGYAQLLMITGPIEEARKQVNYAINLEPNFWLVQNLNSWIYYFEEKYDEALLACTLAYDYNPNFSSNHWLFVLNYAKLGEGEKMKEKLKGIARMYSGTDDYESCIEKAYREEGIDGLFKCLIDINKNNPIKVEGMNGHPFFIAWWNAIIGNDDEAIYYLEQTVAAERKPYHYFNLICTNPDFKRLYNNPRFINVVDQIGLTPYFKK